MTRFDARANLSLTSTSQRHGRRILDPEGRRHANQAHLVAGALAERFGLPMRYGIRLSPVVSVLTGVLATVAHEAGMHSECHHHGTRRVSKSRRFCIGSGRYRIKQRLGGPPNGE